MLSQLKLNEIKGIKNRLYNNLLLKQLIGIFKFLFPKKLNINPNQNLIKAIKGKKKDFLMKKNTHTHTQNTKTHIKKEKKKSTINLNQSYKK